MKSPFFWGIVYLFMAMSFVYFAIQQRGRTGEWDFFTIVLMAIAAYDLMVAVRYFTFRPKVEKK